VTLEEFEVIVSRWFPGFVIPLPLPPKGFPVNTDLTPDTIDKIASMADKSKHQIVKVENSTERLIRYADGETRLIREVPTRNHRIHSVADIKPFLDYTVETIDSAPCVWIGEDGIQITLDDTAESARKDCARLTFETSAEAKFLTGLKGEQFTQGQFLKLCRVKLCDCFTSVDDRLRWISMLKTVSRESTLSQGTQANYTTNKVEAEWPEFLILNIRVFEDPYLNTQPPHQVRIHVEVGATGQFELIPNAADMKAATDAEIAYLTDHLRATAKDYPIFRGQP
jgi:hypothetical protein